MNQVLKELIEHRGAGPVICVCWSQISFKQAREGSGLV